MLYYFTSGDWILCQLPHDSQKRLLLLFVTSFSSLTVFATGDQDSASGTDAGFNETGFPIVDEPITLKVLAARHMLHNEEYAEKEMIKELEAKTNVKIEWEYLPHETDLKKQKINLLFASGELPDIIMGEVDAARFGVVEHQLMPLNEYMKYAYNLKANIYPVVPGLEGQLKFLDGNIYGLPKGEIDQYRTVITLGMINKTWLDNLGLDEPTNLDELYTVLKAFKENDPNGNGKADEIPFSFLPNHGVMGPALIKNAFGVIDDGWNLAVVDEDGKVFNSRQTEEFKNYIKFMNRLYNDGLLDPESLTQDKATYRAKLASGLLGFGNDYSFDIAKEYSKDFVALEPFTAPDGNKYQTTSNMGQGVITTAWGSVTIACKYPEVAVRWLDMFYDNEINFQNSYGPHAYIEDETVILPETPEGKESNKWTREDVLYEDAIYFRIPQWTANVHSIDPGMTRRNAAIERMLPYRGNFMPGTLLYSEEDYNRKLDLETPLVNLMRNKTGSWIINGKIDSEWDAYMEELNNLDVDEWISIIQKSYDHWSGK